MPLEICENSLKFIDQNKHLSIDRILYLASKNNLNGIFIANQIKGKKKTKEKLPEWQQYSLIYPTSISLEQCSSQQTAIYKSKLANGKSLIDLTGGFGVDTYYMSKSFQKTSYCEINKQLFEIVSHNFKTLNSEIETHHKSGIAFIEKVESNFDWIYLDPSRRNDNKQRVYQIEDYTPNIIEFSDLLLKKSQNLLLKTSPFLEPKDVISKLKYIKEIHIVSIKNDCKEVLYLIKKGYTGSIKIHAIDLHTKNDFSFYYEDESKKCTLSQPLQYLYEPNSAILKAGAYQSIGTQFGIYKLNPNSHLYTSNESIENFPGRRFKILATTNFNFKEVNKYIDNNKANISKRNFPYSTHEIQKKLKLKDGGENYLFATTLINNKKVIIICRKY